MKIDITELLEGCVQQSAEFGIPKESLKSRLRLLDVIGNCKSLYEETCKEIREEHVDDSVCGMCIEDCDHGVDGYANECSGFEKDDCFRLNVNKFNDIVFKK